MKVKPEPMGDPEPEQPSFSLDVPHFRFSVQKLGKNIVVTHKDQEIYRVDVTPLAEKAKDLALEAAAEMISKSGSGMMAELMKRVLRK